MGSGGSKKEEEEEENAPLVSYEPFTKESMVKVLEREEEYKKKLKERLGRTAEGRLVDGELRFDEDDDDADGIDLDKDPALVEGNTLPESDYGVCPKNLLGKPLEEIDRFIKERTFIAINSRVRKRYIYRFSATPALYCLPPWNPLRKVCVLIVTNQFFDYAIMLTILVNCVFLALTNPFDTAEYVFLGIYTFEMILKMCARGVIVTKFTYLRDGWNWLDFTVILLGFFTIIITLAGINIGNVAGLRTFRVLRALKTISIFPGLKTIVNALLRSLKMFAEVLTLTTFCMMVFALFGLQVYMGVLRNKCVKTVDYSSLTDTNLTNQYYNTWVKDSSNWESFDEWYRVCGNISGAGACSSGYVCLPDIGENPDFGYTNFDHFGYAMLAAFQLITLDFWENLYNYIIRASGPWNILFFIMVVFFGSFYLVNLMLAVVTMSYEEEALNDGKYRADNKKKKKLEEEKEKEKQAKAQKKATDKGPDIDPKQLEQKIKKNEEKAGKKDGKSGSKASLKGKQNGDNEKKGKDEKKKKKKEKSPIKQDSVQSNDTGVASSIGSIHGSAKPDPKIRKLNKQNSTDLMNTKNSTPVDSGMGSTDRLIEELEVGDAETLTKDFTNKTDRTNSTPVSGQHNQPILGSSSKSNEITTVAEITPMPCENLTVNKTNTKVEVHVPEVGGDTAVREEGVAQTAEVANAGVAEGGDSVDRTAKAVKSCASEAAGTAGVLKTGVSVGSGAIDETAHAVNSGAGGGKEKTKPKSLDTSKSSGADTNAQITNGGQETATGMKTDSEFSSAVNSDSETAGVKPDAKTAMGTNADAETIAGVNATGTNMEGETVTGTNKDNETAMGTNTDNDTATGTNTDAEMATGTNTDSETAMGTNSDTEGAAGSSDESSEVADSEQSTNVSKNARKYPQEETKVDLSVVMEEGAEAEVESNPQTSPIPLRSMRRISGRATPRPSFALLAGAFTDGGPPESILRFQLEEGDDDYDSDDTEADGKSITVIDEETEKEYKDRNCAKCKTCCRCYMPWLKAQNGIYSFVMDPLFEIFIILCIVLNTLFMAMEYHNMPQHLKTSIEIANYVFTAVFTFEAVFKILAMPKLYWMSGWNVFDFLIVILSLIDVALVNVDTPGLSVFRTVRLFRVFKLAQSWGTMRLLLTIIFSALSSLGNLTFILFIFMYIFAVIGMQLFQEFYTTKYFGADIPRWNFIDFQHSIVMIFRVLCGEWIEPLWDCMRVYSEVCMVVFIPTLFVGNFMVLNLFLALLLNSFASDSLQKKEKETKNEVNKFKAAFLRLKMILRIKKKGTVEPEKEKKEGEEEKEKKGDEVEMLEITADGDTKKVDKKTANGHAGNKKLNKSVDAFTAPRDDYTEFNSTKDAKKEHKDNSEETTETKHKHKSKKEEKMEEKKKQMEEKYGKEENSGELVVADCWPLCCSKRCKCCHCCDDAKCYPGWYKFRLAMLKTVDHKAFESIILLLILASSVSLAFEDIYLEFDPVRQEVLTYLNYTFAILFTVEMFMKWAAYGFKKYYSSFWTILDFLIVVVSWASLIADNFGTDISAFRALRTLRAFRPLRAISRWQGMKIVVNALMFAIPAIFNVLLVCLIFWLIFSIVGVQTFMGKFYKCIDADGNRLDRSITANKTECLAKGYRWKNSNVNFDDAGQGFLALLQVATFEGWMEVMVDAIDADAVDKQPYREANFWAYLYFLIFIVFGSFFTLNLFIGVIIDNFNMLKKKYEGTYLDMFLTSNQRNYYNTLKKLGNKKPQKTIKRPKNKCQGFFFDLAISTKFELAIVILIFLNMIAMGVEHYRQSQVITDSLEIINICFTTVFTFEAVIKIIGLRWHYFRRAWNVFDFIIVVLSIIGVILDDLLKDVFITPTLLRVVRIFRIGRVLRLIKAAKGIRKLLFALIISIPALFNIGMLLFLIIFIFAIIGMSAFGRVKHTGALNDLVNFETFERSMLLLFRLTTSAGWNDILDPLFAQPPDCDPNFYTNPRGVKVQYTTGDCGIPWLAAAYMVTFVFITFLIIINMYIAVILENFNQAHEQEEVGVTEDDFDMFYVVWERYDPHATQYIKYDQLSDFVADLDEPLGIPKPNEIALVSFDLPIVKGDKIHCLDILIGLTKHVLGDVESTNEFKELRTQLEEKFKDSFPTRINTEIVSSTIYRKKEDVAAKTLQRAWRHHKAEKTMRHITAMALEAAGKRPGSALSRRLSSVASSLSFNISSGNGKGNQLQLPV